MDDGLAAPNLVVPAPSPRLMSAASPRVLTVSVIPAATVIGCSEVCHTSLGCESNLMAFVDESLNMAVASITKQSEDMIRTLRLGRRNRRINCFIYYFCKCSSQERLLNTGCCVRGISYFERGFPWAITNSA